MMREYDIQNQLENHDRTILHAVHSLRSILDDIERCVKTGEKLHATADAAAKGTVITVAAHARDLLLAYKESP